MQSQTPIVGRRVQTIAVSGKFIARRTRGQRRQPVPYQAFGIESLSLDDRNSQRALIVGNVGYNATAVGVKTKQVVEVNFAVSAERQQQDSLYAAASIIKDCFFPSLGLCFAHPILMIEHRDQAQPGVAQAIDGALQDASSQNVPKNKGRVSGKST